MSGRGRWTIGDFISEGYFKKGKLNGFCKIVNNTTSYRFEGYYVKGQMEGQGKLDTLEELYQGNFKAD